VVFYLKNELKMKKLTDKPMKQMKVFLTNQEHTVVVLASNLAEKSRHDYMKLVILAQAEKDTKDYRKTGTNKK